MSYYASCSKFSCCVVITTLSIFVANIKISVHVIKVFLNHIWTWRMIRMYSEITTQQKRNENRIYNSSMPWPFLRGSCLTQFSLTVTIVHTFYSFHSILLCNIEHKKLYSVIIWSVKMMWTNFVSRNCQWLWACKQAWFWLDQGACHSYQTC